MTPLQFNFFCATLLTLNAGELICLKKKTKKKKHNRTQSHGFTLCMLRRAKVVKCLSLCPSQEDFTCVCPRDHTVSVTFCVLYMRGLCVKLTFDSLVDRIETQVRGLLVKPGDVPCARKEDGSLRGTQPHRGRVCWVWRPRPASRLHPGPAL